MKSIYFIFRQLMLFLALISFGLTSTVHAAWFDRLPATVSQPDGTTIECFASGDEFFNWLHDDDGFTLIVGEDGYYYYGIQDGDIVVPTAFLVGTVNPAIAGLTPWERISQTEYQRRWDVMWQDVDRSQRAPHTGTLNSITVYIRFSDQSEFTVPRSVYDARFNNPEGVSMKNYFYEVSYEQIVIESHHFPETDMSTNLSYQDPFPRSYYEPYHAVNNPNGYQGDNQRRTREHTLLMNAINFIAPEVPDDLDIDADNDGYVDNVCFIIRGNSGAWADLLWAHRWVLYTYQVYIHGKRVYDYTFQPENQNDTYTLCHEMFHVLGAPDLYHYNSTGMTPVGPWDLMHSGFTHMGAFMKWKYANQNWISHIPEITVGGTYTLNPVSSPENNAFRIASPNHSQQYFVVEYRKREGLYESNLPGDGLLVYRINPAAGNGNASGPPDEVYLYRPNGTPTANGNVNQANFSLNVNRTAINDETNPSSFLQNGSPGGLNIFNISAIGETISFDILMGTEVDVGFTSDATTIPPGSYVQFADQSTNLPISWEWNFPGGSPDSSTEQNPLVEYSNIGIYSVSLEASNSQGNGYLEKENYIIVGTPGVQLSSESIVANMEVDQTGFYHVGIQSTGDTWLRYNIDWEMEEVSPESNIAGDVVSMCTHLPANCSGIAWAGGQLYAVTFNGVLHVYDTTLAQTIESFTIHNNATSIAYDGELLWIGNNSGMVYAYDLGGSPTGQSIELMTSEMYSLAWDGEYFIVNRVITTDPLIYRINHDGEIVETIYGGLNGKRALQLTWVPQHKGGHLWVNALGKILRLDDSGGLINVITELNSPSNMSYAIAHDGTDLWFADPMGKLYRIADGLWEWFFINWAENLLEAGGSVQIPVLFNTKGLEVGTYQAMITLETNDYANPLIEMPVSLNVTLPTALIEASQSNISVYAANRSIVIDNPELNTMYAEVFDLTGRLVYTEGHMGKKQARISGLNSGNMYLVRVTTPQQVIVRKVVL